MKASGDRRLRSTGVEISCSEQSDSAERIRSLIRHSGSRTLHFAILPALLGFGRAGGHRQRAVDRLDDVGDRDRAVGLRQPVAAARALVRA